MNTLQRKIKNLKSKLKLKIKNKRMSESKESDYNTSDLIWVGDFQSRKMKANDEEESQEHFRSDISSILRMLKKQLRENTMESPAKRGRHSDIWQVPRQGNVDNKTSTPIPQSKTLDFKPQIDAFKSHFESSPDFKIYDSYTYPVTPAKGASYRNLVRGNTPAPPLPPRNRSKSTPPKVLRNCKFDMHFNTKFGTFPSNHLSLSFSEQYSI
jgi:hypothetical protein